MNKATIKKKNEIIELLKKGSTKEEILKLKFNRNKSKMIEWLEKFTPELTSKEKELLSFKKYDIVKKSKEINIGVPIETLKVLEQYEKRLRAVELKLGTQIQNDETSVDILHINSEILNLKSEVKTIRLNKDLFDQFNTLIAEKNKNYSKTMIWNYMLSEFIKKYKG